MRRGSPTLLVGALVAASLLAGTAVLWSRVTPHQRLASRPRPPPGRRSIP